MLHEFTKYIGTTDMTKHFKDISPIYADRTMKKQLKMVHIESGIECLVVVDNIDITNASKIIKDYCDIRPICEFKCFRYFIFNWSIGFCCFNLRSKFDHIRESMAKHCQS